MANNGAGGGTVAAGKTGAQKKEQDKKVLRSCDWYDSNRISITDRYGLESLFGLQLLERFDEVNEDGDGDDDDDGDTEDSGDGGGGLSAFVDRHFKKGETSSDDEDYPRRSRQKLISKQQQVEKPQKTESKKLQLQTFVEHLPRKLCLDFVADESSGNFLKC